MKYRKNIILSLLSVILACSIVPSLNAQDEYKSPAKAFFSSFLVPGLGQHYVNSAGSIKYFAGAELLMLGLGIGHEKYSDWLEEDYRAFASEHASVDIEGKNKEYFVEISKYNSIYIYNEKMMINRDFDMVIPVTPENIWVWESTEDRLTFHYKRVDADRIGNRAIYFWTGIFLNHMVSGIHAAILAKWHNDRISGIAEKLSFKITPRLSPDNGGLRMKMQYRF